MVNVKKVQPFDSFSMSYKVLYWAGFYKPIGESKRSCRGVYHYIYRGFALMLVITINVTHLIYAWEHHKDIDKLLENVIIEIPTINLVAKILTFKLQSKRIDYLNKLLHDSIFAGNCERDEELLNLEKIEMHRLFKFLHLTVAFNGFLCWPISLLVKRLNNENAGVPGYVPFETKSWIGFFWSLFLEIVPVLWIGHGHITLDHLVATYYSQIRIQLKIIKYNLERLFDSQIAFENALIYRDVLDDNLHHRFAYYVKRYERLIWYSKEVNKLFNVSITLQFISSSSVLCAVIHITSSAQVLSVTFMFNIIMMAIFLVQIFIYCYYGNLVSYESQTINRSVFMSDWFAVSPSFRRQLCVAMTRWSLPIVPTVCGVVPLSMHTFITIIKSSYTLYTILITRKIEEIH